MTSGAKENHAGIGVLEVSSSINRLTLFAGVPNLYYLMSTEFYHSKKPSWVMYTAVWFALMSPVALVTVFSYDQMENQLTTLVLSRRESIASLTALTIGEKIDRVVDLAKAMAGRAKFRQTVARGEWDEAIRVVAMVPQEFSYVDQILLTTPQGIEMADAPSLLSVKGKNFSGYDWYVGVSRGWKSYVSGVYPKGDAYQRNVISVAVPVLADDETVVAILVVEVRLEQVLQWIKEVDVGISGFVYVADRAGKLIAHPRYSPQGDIVDFSSDPSVQKALRGLKGISIDTQPLEKKRQISAYTILPKHGWAVVVAQPVDIAFIERNIALRSLIWIYGLVIILTALLASAVVYSMIVRRRSEEMIRNLSLTDELTGLYNRRGFLTLAEEQLKLARRTKTELTLFFADLDGLKEINDQFGHKEGDMALIDTANILKTIFREGDIIARFAGDEYSVLVVSETQVDNAFYIRRLEEFVHNFNLDSGRRYALSLSLGSSLFDPAKNPSIDKLMSMADEKLYELKRTRKIQEAPILAKETQKVIGL